MINKNTNCQQSLNPSAVLGATCLLALAFCSASQAATLVFARAGGSSGDDNQNSAISGSVSASSTGFFELNSAYNTAGTASARFGVLRTYSEAHAPMSNISSINGSASARFKDDYLFDAPGKTGQTGSFTYTLRINGALSSGLRSAGTENSGSFSSSSYASAQLVVSKNASSFFNSTEAMFSNGTGGVTSGESFLNLTKSFTVPFTFGTAFELDVSLALVTNARGQFGADSIADLGNTLEWGGIVSVNDNTNAPVSDYTLSSGSGTNYIAPIPEPSSTLLLVISGFGLTLVRIRRRP